VLGDMLELGAGERQWHAELGRFAAGCGLDLLVCVGRLAGEVASGAEAAGMAASRVRRYPGAQACAADVAAWCRREDTVLLKGSRGTALERVLASILEHFSDLPKEER